MSIPIFNGWQKMTTIANSKLQYQIQQLNLESAKNSLEKDIYQSYANAKGNAESYNANMKALDASQKAFETTTKRYNAGLATNYDLELSKSNLARAESSAVQSKYNYIFSVKVLDFYQGKPITLN
jgi:outer membrane protein